MNEFLFLFRRDFTTKEAQPSEEVMQSYLTHWQEWLGNLAAQDLLAWPVQYLAPQGKVILPDHLEIEGTLPDMKESIGSLLILKATDYETAINVAKACPILELGGTVEIRQGN